MNKREAFTMIVLALVAATWFLAALLTYHF